MNYVYVVSLQENKALKNYYEQYKIKSAKFVEFAKKEELSAMDNALLIFFLSEKDISDEEMEQISKLGQPKCIKIAFCPKTFTKLNSVCLTHMRADKDYKINHEFAKNLIESFTLPGIVGTDLSDIRKLFAASSRVELRKYQSKLFELDKIKKKIIQEFEKVDNCFFVIRGGPNLTLQDALDLAKAPEHIATHSAWSCRLVENLKGQIELTMYVGRGIKK